MDTDTDTNQDLQLAFDFVKYTNRNIFLTGKAGTGKNYIPERPETIIPRKG
jgi:DNA replication protein DnaC